jgi:hypothetical protein
MKRVRLKEIVYEKAKRMLSLCERDLKQFYVVESRVSVMQLSVDLLDANAGNTSLRSLDAIQLAAAIITHRTIGIDFFVSSDANQLKVARQFFPTFNAETDSP